MTRSLNDLFNLPDDDDDKDDIDGQTQPIKPPPSDDTGGSAIDFYSKDTLDDIDKIEAALPQVKGLEASDKDMDDLAGLAKEAFQNLMDLGMQVDSRFSAEIFNSASGFLGHAITAKTAKVNKKLKMLDLQLKKAELDRKIANDASKAATDQPPESTPIGTGQIIDRNELIRQILEQSKNQPKDK
jgi:hypothetical protein